MSPLECHAGTQLHSADFGRSNNYRLCTNLTA